MEQRDQFSVFDADVQSGPAPEGQEGSPEEPAKDEMVPKTRLDEVRAQRDTLHAQREDMIQSMLNGQPNGQELNAATAPEAFDPVAAAEPVIPDGTDPEVAAVLGPILRANNEAVSKRIHESLEHNVDQRVGPVEERISHSDMVENVGRRVEGFNTVRADVVRMLEQMAPAERERYSSEIGLEALAQSALRVKASRTTSRADMAHSAPFGASEARPTRQEASEADVWAMSDAEFERALERKGMSL